MADTYTTNLNLTKPEPGAAEDTWGISLNSDLDALDAIFGSGGTAVSMGNVTTDRLNATATTAFSTTANSPNASLIIGNSAATAGNGNYKGALGFAKAGTSPQIRSAIVGKQTDSSANVQGLAFLVHSNSVAGSLTEALLIKANNDIIFYDDTGTSENMVWDASADSLNFVDGAKAIFGNSSDLQIYHDGTHSVIDDVGTGNLILQTNGTQISLQSSSEYFVTAQNNGAVTLYHNGSTKLATTSTGVAITGNATFDDNDKAIFGTGSDLQIYHDGSNSIIKDAGAGNLELHATNLVFKNADSSLQYASFISGGAAELRYNGSPKLATTSDGIDVTGRVTADGLTSQGSQGTWEIKNNGYLQDFSRAGANYIRASNAAGNLRFDTGGAIIRQKIGFDGDISFYDDTGSTQGFFWDASAESLGIGTTSPDKKLDVLGDIRSIDSSSNQHQLRPTQIISYATDAILNAQSTGDDVRLNTQGTTRLIATAEGNVGIGTSSPNAKLTLQNGLQRINSTDGSSDARILFSMVDGSNTPSSWIGIPNWNKDGFYIFGPTANGNESAAFYTGANWVFQTGGTERVRIDSSGNFGIGTSSPSSPLHVESSLDYLANFKSTDTTAGILLTDSNGQCRVTNTNGNLILSADKDNQVDNTAIRFMLDTTSNAGNDARVVIREAGLGIGIASPSNPLHVYHATTNQLLRLESGDSTSAALFKDNNGEVLYQNVGGIAQIVSNNSASGTDGIRFLHQSTEVARFDTSGNFGIGTTSPTNKLTVDGDIRIRDSIASLFLQDTDGTSQVSEIKQSAGTTTISSRNNTSNGTILFTGYNGTATTEYARIDSSGNFLVGKTAAGASTQGIQALASGTLGATSTNASSLTLNRRFSDGTIIGFLKDNVSVGSIGTESSNIVIDVPNTGNALIFEGSNGASTTRLAISNGSGFESFRPFNSASDDLFDLGSSTRRFKNLYLSSNIILSGTSANEGYIALPDSDLPTSTTHKLYHSNDTLYWNGESIDTTSTSDYRAKKDIQPLKDGLERVNKLNPVEFRYIEDDKYSEGFIAHELQEVWEHGVHGEKDGDIMQSVSYGRITPLLVKAIQEQQEQIESLKSEIAKLKGE